MTTRAPLRGTQHTGDLPGHKQIKRRRVEDVPTPATGDAPAAPTATTEEKQQPTVVSAMPPVVDPSLQHSRPSGDEDESQSDESSEDEELRAEAEKLFAAKLKKMERQPQASGDDQQHQAPVASTTAGASASAPGRYDSDVLFRRSTATAKPQPKPGQDISSSSSSLFNDVTRSREHKEFLRKFFK